MITKRLKIIRFIAIWMILSTCPGLAKYAFPGSFSSVSVYEWIYYWISIFCGVGLFYKKEWARRWTVGVMLLLFGWVLYIITFEVGPYFSSCVHWLSDAYGLVPGLVRKVLLLLIVTLMIWPFIVIYFLTHQRVKQIFDPNYRPEEDDPVLPIHP